MNQDKRNGQYYQCSSCRKEFYRNAAEAELSMGNGFYCSKECWYQRNKDLKCIADGCDRARRGQGYCKKHYTRFLRHGDANTLVHQPNGSMLIKKYRKKKVEGRRVTEHRYVAEQILRRKLTHVESIHHMNGNKLDNRPENLMLFPTMSAHRQYENRHREYLEQCLRDGILKFVKEPPPFDSGGGILLSEI